MAHILDGKNLSNILAVKLAKKISNAKPKPKLVIFQVGDLEESNTYIKNKKTFAKKIGIITEHVRYKKNISEKKIISDILKRNSNKSVSGIIVQLPIPSRLNRDAIIESIDPRKDVDGLTSKNIKGLFNKKGLFVPATTKGILTLLKRHKVNLVGKKVVIVGKSSLVGKPTALAMLNERATITVCDTNTKDLIGETKDADILIVATGHKYLITNKHVSKHQIVIDVGISVIAGKKAGEGARKIVGDVDYENVKKIVKAITPVPGGVGPMTIVSLFQNVFQAYLLSKKVPE